MLLRRTVRPSITLTLFLLALIAVGTQVGLAQERAAAPANYLTSPAMLDSALEQLLKRTGPAPVVSQIAIAPEQITLRTQGSRAAWHTDQWTVSLFRLWPLTTHIVSGPTPYRGSGVVATAEHSFFGYDEVGIEHLPQVIAEAIARAGFEEAPRVTAVTIERAVALLPEPAYGDVRWNIALASPRETATVYADAAGTIVAADLSGTIRAQRLDLLAQDDWPMAEAQAALAAAIGDSAVLHELSVNDGYLHVDADHPSDPNLSRSYSWDYSGVRYSLIDTPNFLAVGIGGYERFALAELDLTALPAVKAAALAAFESPGAELVSMRAKRTTDRPGAPEALWYMEIRQADGQAGEVVARPDGSILDIVLPEGRRAAAAGPWNAPDSLVAGLELVRSKFEPGTRFSEISFNGTSISVKVEDPRAPGEIASFTVDAGGASRFGFGPSPFDVFSEGTLFTLDDLAPLDATRFGELAERTIARMQMEGLDATRFTISRTPFMFDSRGKIFIEIRAEKDNGWTGGRAAYAIDDGEELDVVLP